MNQHELPLAQKTFIGQSKASLDTALSIAEGATTQKRDIWDPKRSALVQEIVDSLVAKYRSAELIDELRTTTLFTLGDQFLRFYYAVFRREDRSAWSLERFPNGFESLVVEVNQNLAETGQSILDTQKKFPRYRRLPQDELTIITEKGTCTFILDLRSVAGYCLFRGKPAKFYQRLYFSRAEARRSQCVLF